MADTMNVKFLQGTSAALNAMSTSTPGAFYLTTDENRLYYGMSADKKPVPLNEQVTVYAKWDDLSKATDTRKNLIYYAADKNILCIKTENGWMQINPDTDTDTSLNNFTISAPVEDADGNYTYTLTLTEKNINDEVIAGKHEATLTITKDMIADLAVAVEVKVGSAAINDNATTIKTAGVGADGSAGVKISGSDNVKLSGAANNITIEAVDTKYHIDTEITGEKVDVKLVDEETEEQDIFSIQAGAKLDVSLANDVITLAHETSDVTAQEYKASINDTDINEQVISVPKFTVDDYGHVTAAGAENVAVRTKTYTEIAATVGTEAGSIVTGIMDENDTPITAQSGQIFYNTITVDGTPKTVYNQEDLGSFYSASRIDQKLKGLDAFTYKGTVGTGGTVATLPTTSVSIGDTYKTTADGTYRVNGKDVVLHAGDIIIANGVEDQTTGYIGTITWDVIHSENNTDTTYVLTAANNNITLTDSNETPQNITVSGDGVVKLETAGNNLKASHLASGVGAGTYGGDGGNKDFADSIAVPKITVDANGHITSAETVNYKLPEEHEYDFEFDFDTEEVFIVEDETRKKGIKFTEDNWIDADLKANGTNAELAITHKDVSRANKSESGTLDYTDSFVAVAGVVSDAKGHITEVTTKTYTLPTQKTYTLSGASVSAVTGGVKVVDTLTDSTDVATTSEFTLKSTGSLNISASGNVITADLVWGSF